MCVEHRNTMLINHNRTEKKNEKVINEISKVQKRSSKRDSAIN